MLIRWQQAGAAFARRRTSGCDACAIWCADICVPAARRRLDVFQAKCLRRCWGAEAGHRTMIAKQYRPGPGRLAPDPDLPLNLLPA